MYLKLGSGHDHGPSRPNYDYTSLALLDSTKDVKAEALAELLRFKLPRIDAWSSFVPLSNPKSLGSGALL